MKFQKINPCISIVDQVKEAIMLFVHCREKAIKIFADNYLGHSQISFEKIAAIIAITPFLFVGSAVIP